MPEDHVPKDGIYHLEIPSDMLYESFSFEAILFIQMIYALHWYFRQARKITYLMNEDNHVRIESLKKLEMP